MASCMEVCPTNAIIRTEFDTVYIQPDVCNGCRDCIAACPYGVIGFDEASGLARKCTFCYDRLQANLTPACAKACPTESIKFGDLSTMRDVAARAAEPAARRRACPRRGSTATRSTAGCTRCSCSPTSRRPTGCPTPRTRCCRAATTSAATWARWSRRCSAWSARVIAFRDAAAEREGVAPCPSTSSRRRSGSGTSSGTSSWAASPAAPTLLGTILRLVGDQRDEPSRGSPSSSPSRPWPSARSC